ncbi:MAG: hypothetical protein E7576_03205 [Ruminococcaceae bacterium]|nr:hypothetical protein [Oscillospiraceae bacterium]
MSGRGRKGLLTPPTDRELFRIPGFLQDESGTGAFAIAARKTLHEWPLSRVELVELAFPDSDADPGIPARRVVKSQLCAASVETAFYRFIGARTADGGILPGAVRLPRFLGASYAADLETDWLILSYEEGEPESWDGLSRGQIRSRARELSRAFQSFALEGVPVFTDWSRHERFAADMDRIFPALTEEREGEGGLDEEAAAELRRWIDGPAKDCWDSPVGLLHGDLKADNLIRIPGGTVVLDWQRPMKAPLPLEEELSLLLENRAPDPAEENPFRRLACLALSHWYAWAYLTCLPYPFVRSMAVRYAGMGIGSPDGEGERRTNP